MSLVARACPGMFTEHFIRYMLPQERGWSYIHAWQLEEGNHTQWIDERNPARRWWSNVMSKFFKKG